MGRDALFIDLDFSDGNNNAGNSRIRLGNTHLESLVADPPLRPAQVALASRSLHDDTAQGGVLVGDFNAIQRFDRTLHVETDLKDAYLEAGGIEGDEKEGDGPGYEKEGGGPGCEKGWTWGMQSREGQRERFGCSRMDKMLFCGGVRLENLERIGEGVKVPKGEVGEGVVCDGSFGVDGRSSHRVIAHEEVGYHMTRLSRSNPFSSVLTSWGVFLPMLQRLIVEPGSWARVPSSDTCQTCLAGA